MSSVECTARLGIPAIDRARDGGVPAASTVEARALRSWGALCAIGCVLLGGCALTPSADMLACLAPNRRVVVEASGAALPLAAIAKPRNAPAAKPGAKPSTRPVQLHTVVEGPGAFDLDSAVLKDGGKRDLDQLIAAIAKRGAKVGSVVLIGHTDRAEAERNANLSEDRAKSVASYLAGKGMDPKIMFWEGRGATEPLPVTKFCEERGFSLF